MLPIGYERENSQQGPHCISGRSNSASPVWFLLLLRDCQGLCKVLMCCCGQDSSTHNVASRCSQAVAPDDVFDLFFWLAMAWRATCLLCQPVLATACCSWERGRGQRTFQMRLHGKTSALARRGCAGPQGGCEL